jgi:hypothetical protein
MVRTYRDGRGPHGLRLSNLQADIAVARDGDSRCQPFPKCNCHRAAATADQQIGFGVI